MARPQLRRALQSNHHARAAGPRGANSPADTPAARFDSSPSAPGFAAAICCAPRAKCPAAYLVGTADLYDMHQKAGLEAYGTDVPTMRDYRSLLDRKDVDAVIVAVADSSAPPRRARLRGGGQRRLLRKAHVAQRGRRPGHGESGPGWASASSRPAASASATSSTRRPRRFTPRAGLAKCTYIEGTHRPQLAFGRVGLSHSTRCEPGDNRLGDMVLRDAPARPFDAARFFRWRCFADYGEGVAGDLFVHLLSGIQCVSGINAAPSRAYVDRQPDPLQGWPRLSRSARHALRLSRR